MGMAFTDALVDHADVRVALVDRRHSVVGHGLDAGPFVRLRQPSAFYGVASYLAPDIPAQTQTPFEVADGVRVVPVTDWSLWPGPRASTWWWARARPRPTPASGSSRTASTPDALCWVRPAIPGCSTGPSSNRIQRCSSACRRHDGGGSGGGLAAGPVPPARGGRRHVAHRPVGHPHHGEDAHPGHLGARAAAHRRERRTTRSRAPRRAGAHHPRGRGRRGHAPPRRSGRSRTSRGGPTRSRSTRRASPRSAAENAGSTTCSIACAPTGTLGWPGWRSSVDAPREGLRWGAPWCKPRCVLV